MSDPRERFKVQIYNVNSDKIFTLNAKHKYTLNDQQTYQIGIDQSTTQTGIAIKTYDTNKLVYMLDYINEGMLHYKDYIGMFVTALEYLLRQIPVKRLVYEEHSHIRGDSKYASKVLRNLADNISKVQLKFPSTEFCTTSPVVWRSTFLPKDIYKGRMKDNNIKLYVVEECLRRYPNIIKYKSYVGDSYDSFEALGILDGFLEGNFTPDGRRIVTRDLPIEYNHYCIKNLRIYSERTKATFLDEFKEEIKKRGFVQLVHNEDMALDELSRRATTNFKEVILIPLKRNKEYNIYLWDYGIEAKDDEIICLICYRENKTNKITLLDKR